uniref:Glycerol-3-phosphate dehydrogenase n=1 Tax=Percolomonas cosmopolitus TaxID=63605 RepID=A0A7S1KN41_9EUKA|mmetsp:Transcript_2455/g.9239  ORF Transcript_2455/g.9239 Transcript_2455/m.9239 type:complete len:698 (+) Transcript_2455:92-2185(+)
MKLTRRLTTPLLKLSAFGILSATIYKSYSKYQSHRHESLLTNSPLYDRFALREPNLDQDIIEREQQIERLGQEVYDVFVIGGGATGVGCALDATTRGLKTALVERDDFASGTSSRSTKLVHGGVRYLEKAFKQLDYGQYELVKEALAERRTFLDIAPHLSGSLPIMLPIYTWWEVPYFWAGCKAYDFLAGDRGLSSSYLLSHDKALEEFPMLKSDALKAALVYYDGQHNDARMDISLAMTAASHGAAVVNHCEVKDLLKENGKIVGVVVEDILTGKQKEVRAKCVVNATGPFTDGIRKMDNPDVVPIVVPSAGVHVVLPEFFAPEKMGLLDPSTSDGRVIFFLPWQGKTIAGTTDTKSELTYDPYPNEKDVDFIITELDNYLSDNVKLRRSDILAAWSGLRPLVRDPNQKGTENLSRSHVVEVSDSGLVSISGGKWTTYRRMAQDAIDTAIKVHNLPAGGPCLTEKVKLLGAHGWYPMLHIKLVQEFGFDKAVANHLANTYGGLAYEIAKHAKDTGLHNPVKGVRLQAGFPYIEAEVVFSIHKEYARTVVDFIARRTRLAFLDAHACLDALPRVAEIMGKELKWDSKRTAQEISTAKKFLLTMGLVDSLAPFNRVEMSNYRQLFFELDSDRDGYIGWKELQSALQQLDISTDPNVLQSHFGDEKVEFGSFVDLIHHYNQNKSFDEKKFTSRARISTL